MKQVALALLCTLFFSVPVFSQIHISNFHYKVSECSRLDSAAFYKINDVQYPVFEPGDLVIVENLQNELKASKFKKKDEGTYTVEIKEGWEKVTVSSTSEKVSDLKLYQIAKVIRETKANWRPLIANDVLVTQYTLTLSFELWIDK